MKTLFYRRNPLIFGMAFVLLMLAGCRTYKQDAVSLLTDALTAYSWSSKDTHHIQKAICRINSALENDNWIDDTHLTLEGGKSVFDTDVKAVKELVKVDAGDLTVINDAIADITQGDLGVSGTLVQDAMNDVNADPNELALAESAWDAAYTAFGSSDYFAIINNSEEAWVHAWKALHPNKH